MTKPYSVTAEQIAQEIDTDLVRGLTSDEASLRYAKNGPNSLGEEKKVPLWKRFLQQFADAMVIILIAAAALSAYMAFKSGGGFEEWIDVIVILAIVILNACLGVYQEGKADQALAALKKMSSPQTKVIRDGKLHSQSQGELQFTEYGLSGPVIFEVSRDACQGRGKWESLLDFLPHLSHEQLYRELDRRRTTDLPVEELLTGILHNRLGRVLSKAAGLRGSGLCRDLRDGELEAVCHAVKAFSVSLTEPMGMDSAQVTAGGILTGEFDPQTMESKLVPGLYACGEVLDIDGDCGGYNLQWAWSSGRMAGLSAGKESV